MRKYNLNEHYFKTWSIEMAYLLGFFCADGHLATHRNFFSICIHKKDIYILQNFLKFLDYDGIIYDYGKRSTVSIQISSKEITKDLMNFGLTRHKSQELKWIEQIPELYISHFIRGYFDGDGHIGLTQAHNPNNKNLVLSIVGTKLFLERLKLEFEKHYGNIVGHLRNEDTYYTLFFSGSKIIYAFLDWIYKDSTEETRLKRKYDIYYKYINNETYIEETVKIDFELAEKIRDDFTNGLNSNELSLKYNVNRCSIKPILDNITHVKEDNRDVRSYLYVEAWGENKHYLDWLKDVRCIVDKHTLYDRLFKRNVPPEIAMTVIPDKGKTLWANPNAKKKTYLFTLDGEEKSIRGWSQDPRCEVNYQKLKDRLLKNNLSLEVALKT
jgi:hypothetical protein